ncbi:Uncharacterised protein [Mycobacteroides abscessus subsp. abscessus]|nr:Uncharacterised protein [Mycobacteroides abscessus subsp. abscessus]
MRSAKNAPFTSANYPDATANGVFFVALEDNGHVYALVLNGDNSAGVIADLDSKIGCAMGLDYDALTEQLWVMADDGYEGRLARLTFTGKESPVVVHMRRPANMPNVNNEGFALSDRCVENARPAWFFQDGVEKDALTSVQVPCVFEGPTDDTGASDGAQPGDPAGEGTPAEPGGPAEPAVPGAPGEGEGPTDAGQSSDEQPSGESSQPGGAERGAAARPHESGAAGATRAGQLPRTGAETRVLGGFACALVVAGAVLASRRTRRA